MGRLTIDTNPIELDRNCSSKTNGTRKLISRRERSLKTVSMHMSV
jgi:hypothetical protein